MTDSDTHTVWPVAVGVTVTASALDIISGNRPEEVNLEQNDKLTEKIHHVNITPENHS